MDPKTQSPSDRIYEDFEPSFEWTRDQTSVTLLVRLPGFSRQEFKIVYTTILSISGERMITENKWLRFNKEFSIPSDCDTKSFMGAKFQNGVLHITFPRVKLQEITKKAPAEEEQEKEASRPIMVKTSSIGVSKETPQIKEPTKSLPKEDSQSEQKEIMTLYEDFEPHFEWTRDGKSATLLVKLPGFSKEHLKNIEFTSVLTISGERKMTETKRHRFNKQISIPSDCDTDKMNAKLQNGVLSVMFPLVATPTKPQEITKKPPAEEDSVRTTEGKEEKEVTKPSSSKGASQRAPAKAEPEEKTKGPEDPRLQAEVPMLEAPTKRVDKQKVAEEVPPKPREEDKAGVKTNNEVSEKTPQKEKETTKTEIPKEVSEETMKPSSEAPRLQTQRIDQQKDAEEEKAEVKSNNEVSEKIPKKEKETTIKTPEEASQSGGKTMMKPQETTKQPEAAPSTQRFDQQKIAQEVISKPKQDKAEAKTSEILEDIPKKEKEPSFTKEEEKKVAYAEKVAQKQGAKMITKAKTRILDFTLSLRSTDKDDDDKKVLGGLKKPQLKKLIVVILLVVVLGLYAKNAFRSTSYLGGSEFQEL